MASRRLANEAPAPHEPLHERRRSYFDLAHQTLRREWDVLILADNTTLGDGIDRQYFRDGSPEFQREYQRGEPRGMWRSWWPNGHQRMEASYGTSEPAPMRWWHENGQLSSEGLARDGLKEGEWTFWHPNGVVASKGRYSAGRREGEWSFFDEQGALNETATYRADVKVERH